MKISNTSIIIIVGFCFFCVTFLILGKFSFVLVNRNEKTRRDVVASRSNELSLVLPEELKGKPFSNTRVLLSRPNENKEIEILLTSIFPPYEEIENSDICEKILVVTKNNNLKICEYELKLILDNGKEIVYKINLKREVCSVFSL